MIHHSSQHNQRDNKMGRLSPVQETFSSFFSINIYAIPLKISCFLAGGFLSYASFLNVFFVSTGLPKFKAGIITGLTYGPPIVAGPVWGYLADFSGRRKFILTVLCMGAALPLLATPWVAKSIYPQSKFQCGNVSVFARHHYNLSSALPVAPPGPADLNGESLNSMDLQLGEFRSVAECEHLREAAQNTLFWVLLSIMLVASVFLVPLQPHVEAIVMSGVMSGPSETSYGAQRIFGCIGLSAVTYLAGQTSSEFHLEDVSQFSAAIFVVIPCALLLIPVGWCILNRLIIVPAEESAEKKVPHERFGDMKKTHLRQLLNLCMDVDVALFLGTVLVLGK